LRARPLWRNQLLRESKHCGIPNKFLWCYTLYPRFWEGELGGVDEKGRGGGLELGSMGWRKLEKVGREKK